MMPVVDHNRNIQRIIDRIKAYTPLYDNGATVGKIRQVVFGQPVSKSSIKQKPAIYVTTSDSIQNTRYSYGFSIPNNQNQISVSYEITIVAAVKDQIVNAEKQLYDILMNLRDMASADPRFSDPQSPGTDQIFSRSVINDPRWDTKLKGQLITSVSVILFATIGSAVSVTLPGPFILDLLSIPNSPEGFNFDENFSDDQKRCVDSTTEKGTFLFEYDNTPTNEATILALLGTSGTITLTKNGVSRQITVEFVEINPTPKFDELERAILHVEKTN